MNIHDVYQKGYAVGDYMTNKEVYEAMQAFKQAADALIGLGPCFAIAFKEANRCYLWLDSVAVARGML